MSYDIPVDKLSDNCFSNGKSASEIRSRYAELAFATLNASCYIYLGNFGINFRVANNAELKYDPKLNRLVFPLEYKGVNYGYVGRALDGVLPKWYVYLRRLGCPYTPLSAMARENVPKHVLLVEDCLSALRGMAVVDCIALLGTSISSNTIPYLIGYDRIFIALDDDATAKSLALQQQLSCYRPTKIIPIKTDIKYWSNEQLETLKQEIEND